MRRKEELKSVRVPLTKANIKRLKLMAFYQNCTMRAIAELAFDRVIEKGTDLSRTPVDGLGHRIELVMSLSSRAHHALKGLSLKFDVPMTHLAGYLVAEEVEKYWQRRERTSGEKENIDEIPYQPIQSTQNA